MARLLTKCLFSAIRASTMAVQATWLCLFTQKIPCICIDARDEFTPWYHPDFCYYYNRHSIRITCVHVPGYFRSSVSLRLLRCEFSDFIFTSEGFQPMTFRLFPYIRKMNLVRMPESSGIYDTFTAFIALHFSFGRYKSQACFYFPQLQSQSSSSQSQSHSPPS